MWRRRLVVARCTVRYRVHPPATANIPRTRRVSRAAVARGVRRRHHSFALLNTQRSTLEAERIPLPPCRALRILTQRAQSVRKERRDLRKSKYLSLCDLCEVSATFALKFFRTVQRATTRYPPNEVSRAEVDRGVRRRHFSFALLNPQRTTLQSGKDSASPFPSVFSVPSVVDQIPKS